MSMDQSILGCVLPGQCHQGPLFWYVRSTLAMVVQFRPLQIKDPIKESRKDDLQYYSKTFVWRHADQRSTWESQVLVLCMRTVVEVRLHCRNCPPLLPLPAVSRTETSAAGKTHTHKLGDSKWKHDWSIGKSPCLKIWRPTWRLTLALSSSNPGAWSASIPLKDDRTDHLMSALSGEGEGTVQPGSY